MTRRVSGFQSTISPVPVIVIPWSMSVSLSASAQIPPMSRFRIASSISAISRGISASRAWKNGDVSASRCASSVCLKAGTSATIIAIGRSTPASWTAYESSSVSPIFHLLKPPVTERLADPAPRRAKREISSGARRSPAAWAAAVASAANPEALAPSPMFDGKSFTLAIRNGSESGARPRMTSTTARMRSMSRAFTSRPSIVAVSRPTPPNSTVVRLVRGAVHTLIESWNGSRRTGSARPWYLMSPWIGWAAAVAFMSGPRIRLDVEDDLGDALLRVDGQSMASHRLDDEFQLVTLLVDRFAAGPSAQRGAVQLHIEGREEEALRLVDVEEFGEPPEHEGRDILRGEADLDLPDRFDRAEIGDEAEHPLGRVREEFVQRGSVRSDPDIRGVLDFFVPNGQALIEDPRREQSGIQPMRDVVRRRGGREEDRPGPRVDLGEDALREFVIRAIEEDEFHLVMRPEALEVRVGLVRDHPGAGTLHVHHVPHATGCPFVRHERVEGGEVDLSVRLDRMEEGLRKAFDGAGDRLALEQRFAAGPAQVPNPAGIGLKVAREAEDLLHRRVDAHPREVPALDRVHRVAPATAQVACVQPHEDRRDADEGAFPLDRHIAFAEQELLPFARGDGGLGLHRASDEP